MANEWSISFQCSLVTFKTQYSRRIQFLTFHTIFLRGIKFSLNSSSNSVLINWIIDCFIFRFEKLLLFDLWHSFKSQLIYWNVDSMKEIHYLAKLFSLPSFLLLIIVSFLPFIWNSRPENLENLTKNPASSILMPYRS